MAATHRNLFLRAVREAKKILRAKPAQLSIFDKE